MVQKNRANGESIWSKPCNFPSGMNQAASLRLGDLEAQEFSSTQSWPPNQQLTDCLQFKEEQNLECNGTCTVLSLDGEVEPGVAVVVRLRAQAADALASYRPTTSQLKGQDRVTRRERTFV